MQNNNKVFTIINTILLLGAVGLLIYFGTNNKKNESQKVEKPVADMHARPTTDNIPTVSLNDLLDKPSPDFTLADRNGKSYSLADLRGKNVILFFNEGLMCYPACWNQIVALAKDERLKNNDTVVLSIVVDPPGEWQNAIAKMPELAQATVVFDTNATVSKQFGMLTTASSMHYGSLPGHSFVIIDKAGIIKHIFDDPNMSIHDDLLVTEIEKLNK